MVETLPNVYDLLHPSPPTLQQLSAIVIVVHLHRRELEKHRTYGRLSEYLFAKDFSLENEIPNLPSSIHDTIKVFIKKFGLSTIEWQNDHFERVFAPRSNGSSPYSVFNDFDDLVYDFDGTVHYVTTAEKMMLCSRFSTEEKFKIACMYCFEDDIRRLWPSVSENITLEGLNFVDCALLFYWVCRFKNELHTIPNRRNESIDDVMLSYIREFDRASLHYFWNRRNDENRFSGAVKLSKYSPELFVRFILPKLNEQELDRFATKYDRNLMIDLLFNSPKSARICVLPTWAYFKNTMNESKFSEIVEGMLLAETDHLYGAKSYVIERMLSSRTNRFILPNGIARTNHHHITRRYENLPTSMRKWLESAEHETYLRVCCEVWKSAPCNLKQSAIQNNLNKYCLFQRSSFRPTSPREVRFLLTILSHATPEQRNTFWKNTWQNLLTDMPITDLDKIMKLCFENENEIKLFKENTMAKYETIAVHCGQLVCGACFRELDEFLNFICDDIQTKKNWKQHLLLVCFQDNNFKHIHLFRAESMKKFIEDAYENDLATELKNQLVSLFLSRFSTLGVGAIRNALFGSVMNFVDAFVSPEETKKELKQKFFDCLKEHLIASTVGRFEANKLHEFLVWCLGSADEVTKFKRSISADEVFQNMVPGVESLRRYNFKPNAFNYPVNLDEFLKWYFNTSEEIEQFRMKFSKVFRSFVPR